jgi:hypothetical protein
MSKNPCSDNCLDNAAGLNKSCYCKTLNRDLLSQLLQADSLTNEIFTSHPQLFANTAVFISDQQQKQIQAILQAIETVIHLPGFQSQLISQEQPRNSARGVFVGVDFHINDAGPKVIEINTNAGGGFLNAALLAAQTACCEVLNPAVPKIEQDLQKNFVEMFREEWRLARGDAALQNMVILDQSPDTQFLYPEFRVAQKVLQSAGINCWILDPSDLRWDGQVLFYQQYKIDAIYNRLTDFSLSQIEHQDLRQAYDRDAVLITPNPWHHAIYADKRNLILLSDAELLRKSGATESDIDLLINAIPKTVLVTADKADQLWQNRKQLFFKPAMGYGSKAAYRGDKITSKVWQEILQGDYIAQALVPPAQRGMLLDQQTTELKMDIRAYAYQGKLQLLAARLYQGQTTNFRTAGGGFAPVFVVN